MSSHLICGVLSGELPSGLASTQVVEGLADRAGRPGTAERLAALVAEINPDVVYLHNVFTADVVEALDAPGRRYRLWWYVHDHYPTCLTELRLRSDGRACGERLGAGCLAALDREDCVRRHPERPLGATQLAERSDLLGALRRADEVIVVSSFMRRLLLEHLPDLAGRLHLAPPHPPGPLAVRRRDGLRPYGDRHRRRRADRRSGQGGLRRPDHRREGPRRGGGRAPSAARYPSHRAPHRRRSGEPRTLAALLGAGAGGHGQRPQLDISHLGHLDAAGVDALFAAADVVVVPSRWPEPLGVVAAEALRAGAVVIASDVGGLDTFVHHGENGLLVAPGDVDAWAAALDRALGELIHRREGRPVDAIAPDTLAAATMDNHLRALEVLFSW